MGEEITGARSADRSLSSAGMETEERSSSYAREKARGEKKGGKRASAKARTKPKEAWRGFFFSSGAEERCLILTAPQLP